MPERIRGDRVLLSTAEAVQASGLSREHIQRLARQGRVEGIKLGHDWLIFEDTLQAFLAHPRKTGPKPKDSQGEPRAESTSTPSDGVNKNTGLSEY